VKLFLDECYDVHDVESSLKTLMSSLHESQDLLSVCCCGGM
jgi:hypothetical protein